LLLEHKELHNGFLDAYTKLMAEYKASLLKIEASAATLAVFEKEISKLFNTIWTMRDSKGVARAYTFDEAMGGLRQSLAKEVRSLLLGAYMSGDQVSFSKRAYGKKTARKLRTLTETWLYVVRNHTNLDIIKDNFPESWIFYHTQEDDRVDDVCSQCSDITLKKHYSPSEYPFECLPPLHFNCRCSIEPKID
jgi:post-segregation antitoxin (ccd killing protein)